MWLVILASLIASIVALIRSGTSSELIGKLTLRIAALEAEISRLRKADIEPPEKANVASIPTPPVIVPPVPPPLPATSKRVEPRRPSGVEEQAGIATVHMEKKALKREINWEQFMGAKLFAWVGGFALFLGIAFFVKYSFERNLIPPGVRVALGFVSGLGLLIGGVRMRQKAAYLVTSQTFCATGIVVLYACTYAARSFLFLGTLPAFLLMTLITAVAFLLAVRLNAQVVALLGMFGGFLTPILLPLEQDNPLALFGYIALLDAGLLAVALHRGWNYLVPLGAAGTIFTELFWSSHYFNAGRYLEGNRVLIPMTVLVGFTALFSAALLVAKRYHRRESMLAGSSVALAATAFGFAFYFLGSSSVAHQPVTLFGFVFLVDLLVLTLAWADAKRGAIQTASGVVVFTLLAIWTGCWLTPPLLHTALGLYLVFTLFHSLAPILLQRFGKVAKPTVWRHVFPVFALMLVISPLSGPTELSYLIWPFVLLVDLLAIAMAIAAMTLLPIFLAMALTLAVLGGWLAQIPADLSGLPFLLFVLGGFALFFLLTSQWAIRRMSFMAEQHARSVDSSSNPPMPDGLILLLPASSIVLPFVLLIMVTTRLPITDPTPVFGLALLLGGFLLAVSKKFNVEGLPIVGLLSTIALEVTWHVDHFNPQAAAAPLGWYLVFYALFLLYPFLFEKAAEHKRGLVWAASALAGPLHFHLVFRLVKSAYPDFVMGLLPAAFAIPSLLGLLFLSRRISREDFAKSGRLAWFGGVSLFFITLIFPIQFDKEWITIGWALEGMALCWLFHRIAHPGLRAVGVFLLFIAFTRLALNPAVLGYHARSAVPILNWYLYAYGITIVAFFTTARLLAPPRNIVMGSNTPPLLQALGTLLAFLLVNVEIADYFTAPDSPVVTLQFSGNLARDMTYSIAWSLFALLLVIIGIRKKLAPVRYAGSGLLSLTILKLFLHDTSQLNDLYRIGAFILVAIVAIAAAFLYQRLIAASKTATDA